MDADRAAADSGLPHARMADDQRPQAQKPDPGPEADRNDQPRLQFAVLTGPGAQPRLLGPFAVYRAVLGLLGVLGVIADDDVRVGIKEGVLGVRILDLIRRAKRLGLAGEALVQGRCRRITLLLEEQVAHGERDQSGADHGHQDAELQEHENNKQGREESQADQGIFQKGHYSSLAASRPSPRGCGR
ncbi:hypothetical protein ARTHRO9AX_200113 [Arthrobacter sp. 9AX]|nr:hypothetical protein ARTHRO9AX_200113 [Arthrobacter sp. 9AX]